MSRRHKRPASSPTSGASHLDQPDADVLTMIARVLNGELDGLDLVALYAATQRRIEELLATRRFPAPPT